MKIMSGVRSDETLEYMLSRRSVMAQLLKEPAVVLFDLRRDAARCLRGKDQGFIRAG